MTRVCVTGGRGHQDRALVFATLDRVRAKHPGLEIAQGACQTGADLYAREWARERGVDCHDYPADWALGRKAGPLRNSHMLVHFGPDAVVAFFGGDGTRDCVAQAEMLGVSVWRVGW